MPISVRDLFQYLDNQYDVQSWWPKDNAFEVAIGAILTQQTSWNNVVVVMNELRSRNLLSASALAQADSDELEKLLHPVGFFRQKTTRLKSLASYINDNYGSDIDLLINKDLDESRKELLQLPGIGLETADSILLFGASHPLFIAATYSRRILNRVGIIHSQDYEEIRAFVEREMGKDSNVLADFYALLVEHAKKHCQSKPRCLNCCLENVCDSRHQEHQVTHHGDE